MRALCRRMSSSVASECASRVGAGVGDEVVGEDVLHQLQRLVKEVFLVDSGVLAFYLRRSQRARMRT